MNLGKEMPTIWPIKSKGGGGEGVRKVFEAVFVLGRFTVYLCLVFAPLSHWQLLCTPFCRLAAKAYNAGQMPFCLFAF